MYTVGDNSEGGRLPDGLTEICGTNEYYRIDTVVDKEGKLVRKMLGEGGEGTVYSGKRRSDNASVAIKHITKIDVTDWEMVHGQQVPMEVALLLRVSHISSVIKLLDWIERQGYFLLILELPKPCMDLFSYITKHGPLPEKVAQNMMVQLIHTVKACHSAGIIHRDIKDENILVTYDYLNNPLLKLIDFGCGAFFEEGKIYTDFLGTEMYNPPEWHQDNYYEGESGTVWSLGILLHDLVVGDIPFQNSNQIINAMIEIPQHLNLSNECHALMNWCLQVRPQDRPTLDQIANHLWLKPATESHIIANGTHHS